MDRMKTLRNWSIGCLPLLVSLLTAASASDPNHLARDIFKELIEINTATSTGETTTAVNALAVRFRNAGFSEADIHIFAPAPRKSGLVVRLRGAGRDRPILFIGHL